MTLADKLRFYFEAIETSAKSDNNNAKQIISAELKRRHNAGESLSPEEARVP